ncbi:MAG: hypothetical protein M0017_07520 [Desulfobacteraceae bacterium]|nr:hypothetical protein [Desulfobacteraceae bacterium]
MPWLPGEFLELERAQWLDREQIEEVQWRRFQLLLQHAVAHSPHYREKLRQAGIRPEDIRSREDLVHLPVTTREELRQPERLLARTTAPGALRSSMTSGSSGRRTTTYFDPAGWRKAKYLLKLRARLACGLRPWHRLAVISEAVPRTDFWKRVLLRQRHFSVLEPMEKLLPALRAFQPEAVYGFPSAFALLAAERNPGFRPRLLFTSSEMLDPATRRKIEKGFGTEVLDIYGSTEVKEVSWECPEHQGYHINSDWLLVEFIKDGKPSEAPDAEILLTPLFNYGMPLLRYRVGDTGRALPGSCRCGRGLPLMAPSSGRQVDYFTLPDGSRLAPYAMTCAIEAIEGMRQYQIRQQARDRVEVRIVPTPQFDGAQESLIRQALAPLLPGVAIDIQLRPGLEKEKSGKFRIVSTAVHETVQPEKASP